MKISNLNCELPNGYLVKLTSSLSFILLILFLFNKPGLAQSGAGYFPDLVIPATVGVNTHFVTGGTVDHDMIKDAGFRFIRQDFFWYLIETTKGEYNWAPYDTLVQELDQRGIRLLATLNLNNTLYAATTRTAFTDTADIAAFANFAAAAALRYKNSHVVWEIYNEPNQGNTWKPTPTGTEYGNFAIKVCQAIRAVDPNAAIIAPAEAGAGTSFLTSIFKTGLLQYIDGVSVHPYRDGPPPSIPESVGSSIKSIQSLIAQYAPAGKKIYVISGEWGYSTCNLTTGVSLQTQADYIARMQLFNMSLGIPITIWYDWKNDGTDQSQIGQNRGVVNSILALKPSYVAVKILSSELYGYRITGTYNTTTSGDNVFILKDTLGNTKIAAWSQGSSHYVSLPLSSFSFPDTLKQVWWISSNAVEGAINVQAGKFLVNLTNTPAYYSITAPTPISAIVPIPSIPLLISPDSTETNVIRYANFQWNSSPSDFSVKYHFQLAADSVSSSDGSFITQNVVFDTTLEEDTAVVLSAPLDPDKVYYWHVNASNIGGTSLYSFPHVFTTGNIMALPSVPKSIIPSQLAVDVARKPYFIWNTSIYADKYRFQIANEYQVYSKGDSTGRFYSQNIVFDTTVADTTLHLTIPLDSSSVYFWHVTALNGAGISGYSTTVKFTTGSSIDAVKVISDAPNKFELLQNYPNPFNPSTVISYSIPKSGFVSLIVYNVLGQQVANLVYGFQRAGYYSINFNASKLSSGVYLYRLQSSGSVLTRKLLLVK